MTLYSTYLAYSSMKRILKVINIAKGYVVSDAVQRLDLCILKGSKDIRKFVLCLLSSKCLSEKDKLNIYATEGFKSRKSVRASKSPRRSTRRGARIFISGNLDSGVNINDGK